MPDDTTKPNILIQFDPDPQPSSFDRVVAVDAGADRVFAYGGVKPEQVEALVYGAIFTRGPQDLKHTAIFIGGSDVAAGEAILKRVTQTFFGPMRVSVLFDANGANTTAAAAVLAAGLHLNLGGADALILGGTGPVGLRVGLLLAHEGAKVRLASRSADRSADAVNALRQSVPDANVRSCAIGGDGDFAQALEGVDLLVSAGKAGVRMISSKAWHAADMLDVAIDLNAVPPAGVEGVDPMDKAAEREGVTTYGAIAVGGTKMKIHKAAVRALFEGNDRVLDAEQVYALGKQVMA
jgi:methylenetetrahydrofolate/methylenetetrahydromethanopterin dehydrogenase (NADP+)